MKPTFLRVGTPSPSTTRPPATFSTPGLPSLDSTNSAVASSVATAPIPIPSTAVAGDICVVVGQSESNGVSTFGSDWTNLYTRSTLNWAYAKVLTASDLTGGTVTFSAAGTDVAMFSYLIKANGSALDVADIAISGEVADLSANPRETPPVFVPTSGDYLVVVHWHANKGGFTTDQATDGPSGYDILGSADEGDSPLGPAVYLWSSLKTLTGAEDPGDITWSDSLGGRVYESRTIAIPISAATNLDNNRFVATADQTIANTTTETSMFGTGEGSLTLPADYLIPGRTIDVRMRGQLSDTGTPNFTIKLKLGSTVICSVGPTALTGVSSVEWMLDLMLTCRSAGASGVVVAGGLFDYDDGTELSLSSGTNVNVDTTGALAIDVTWQWGTADAANTVTVRESIVR